MPAADSCIGILAADRVLIFTAQRPPGSKRRWQTALHYLAEEHALTDPDDIHAVPAASSEADKITLSVVTKSWLKQIVTGCAAAKLPLRIVVAESLMPALPDNGWTMVWNGRDGFVRTSPTTGLALDCGSNQDAPLALIRALSTAPAPHHIELRFAESPAQIEMPAWQLPVALVPGKKWDWRSAPIDAALPNLLWGEFAPRLRLLDKLPRLRPALFILLAAFCIEAIGTHIEWAMLASEKHALTQNIERTFHAAFGDESTLIDAPLQMQRNLTALRHEAGVGDDADFLALLDTAISAFGTPNPGAVRALSYESGKLKLDLKLAKPADFESLTEKLQRNGLRIRTDQLHDAGDGMEAELTITLGGLR